MAISISVSSITVDANNRVHVRFSDGQGYEFASKQQALDWVKNLDLSRQEGTDLIKELILAWWIKQDPTGATPSLVIGKTVTFNLAATPPLTFG